MLESIVKNRLMWFPEIGMGYFPVNPCVYDKAYFDKYIKMARTEMGVRIADMRTELVLRYWDNGGELLDVGIGCGAFIDSIENYGDVKGHDVNLVAVEWLERKSLYADPYAPGACFQAMTFWDSLEHIEEPDRILKSAGRWVFVSMPIYTSAAHVLVSRHFRKDEHYWYFTERGLISFFDRQGCDIVEMNNMETVAGREDIKTFVFKRRDV